MMIYTSPVIPRVNVSPPSRNVFYLSNQSVRQLNRRELTWIDYFTDQFILYGSLWACIGTTYPIWENAPVFINGDNAGQMFADRMRLEPYATGRIDPFIKPLVINGETIRWDWGEPVTVVTNDFYAKNIIEPMFFTFMGLYLRSKNYHPALLIGELFTMSVLYEFTIRPFFMNASFEQLLKNPSLGIMLSVLFDEVSNYLLSTPYTALHVLAYIMNPFKLIPNSRVTSLIFLSPFVPRISLETHVSF